MAMNRELKIVRVTNSPSVYPEFAEASAEYPQLVMYVKDEYAVFVVDPKTGDFWPANEFFYMYSVTAFLMDPIELD